MPRVMRWKNPCALKGRRRFDSLAGGEGTLPVPLQDKNPGMNHPSGSPTAPPSNDIHISRDIFTFVNIERHE